MTQIPEGFVLWFTIEKRVDEGAANAPLFGSAPVRYAHLRSTEERSIHPQSVTHAVRRKCYLSGEELP